MANKTDRRRRWAGAIFLGLAVIMLVVGQIFDQTLRARVGQSGFLLFWMVCFLFTFLAIVVAFLDLSAVRRRTQDEQRALLEDTLGEIARRGGRRPEGGGQRAEGGGRKKENNGG